MNTQSKREVCRCGVCHAEIYKDLAQVVMFPFGNFSEIPYYSCQYHGCFDTLHDQARAAWDELDAADHDQDEETA